MKRVFCLLLISLCLLPACAAAEETTLYIPAHTQSIESEAFAGTTSLSHVVLPEGVTSIGARAFADSSLSVITLPKSLTSIASDAFENCDITTAYVYEDSYAEAFCIEHDLTYIPKLKNITAICPWAAGGGSDATLRAFVGSPTADALVDGSIIVDNVTGGGTIGHQAIANASPDGKTIGLITFELSTYSPLGTSNLTYADFDPICRISTDAAAITVNTDWATANGITDVASFVAYAKAHPGKVMMGGSSSGSVWHIAGGYLMNATGIDIQMITYANGAADAVKAAAHGTIQGVTVSPAEARAFIGNGLTVLGVMDSQRSPLFPDIPTCAEEGYDLNFTFFRGIALPKGVDEATRQAIISLCAAAIEDEEFVAFANNNGSSIAYQNASDFTAFLKQNSEIVADALQTLGIK